MEKITPEIAIIGGCGHVGLPLALAFAQAGKKVVSIDRDAAAVDQVSSGKMPFMDRGADRVLRSTLAAGTFFCSTDPRFISEAKAVITVVGTPVDEYLNPQLHLIVDVVEEYAKHLRNGQLFILRSTIFPGTTERVERELRKRGLEIDVAFCPERVTEGNALEEIHSLPEIVAGCTLQAQERAKELFQTFTSDIVTVKPIAAELAKLFTNAWRYAQFAVANQFFMIANDHRIDFYEIYKAMTHNYPRGKSFAGAGFAAGPCLFKDTVQLHAFNNNAFFMGQASVMVNEGLPNYLVKRLVARFPLKEMVVGILGMAFKADVDDPRSSLAYKLRKILLTEAREVLCSDPYILDSRFVGLDELRHKADIIIIGTPHSDYRGMEFGGKSVVDIWNIIPGRLETV